MASIRSDAWIAKWRIVKTLWKLNLVKNNEIPVLAWRDKDEMAKYTIHKD